METTSIEARAHARADAERWFTDADRKALLGIDGQTIADLREAAPLLREHVPTVVGDFYGRVMSVPSLAAIVGEHSTVDRLSGTLARYVEDFATTDLGPGHVENRRRIAAVHDRIALPIDAYQAQIQSIRATWLRALLDTDRKGRVRRAPDEIVRLFTSLDKALTFDEGTVSLYFTDALRETLADVQAQTEAAEATQAELDSLAGQLAAAAQEAAASVQEMSASAEQVAHEVTEASQESHAADEAATAGMEALGETEASVHRVREATGRLSGFAGTLEDSSSRIGEISAVLRQTADQINLLALNAAIEAARAGEAGRGFAVVADEVRKLAESTQRHLVESNEAIDAMQRTIQQVRAAGSEAGEEVELLVSATGAVRERFEAIAAAAGGANRSLEAIAAASEEVAATAGENGRSSEEVAHLAENIKAVANALA